MACVIEVGPDDSEAIVAARVAHARLLGNVSEGSISVVMEERVACALQAAWTALDIDSAIFAVGRAAELGQIVEVEVNIVCHHEVDKSVAVIVSE